MGFGDPPGLQKRLLGLLAIPLSHLGSCDWCTMGAFWACLSGIVQCTVQ